MQVKISRAKQPERLSRRAGKLFTDAQAAGFIHLGWLTVTLKIRITVAAFASREGDTVLALHGLSNAEKFDPQAEDLVSHLDRGRKLTTTTFGLAVSQTSRGVFKFSHPNLGLTALLLEHREHMRELKAKPVMLVRSLKDFEESLRSYLAYENPPQKAESNIEVPVNGKRRVSGGRPKTVLDGSYVEVGSPSVRLILKRGEYQWGGKDIHDAGTFALTKVDGFAYVVRFDSNNPDFKGSPTEWRLTRQKTVYVLKEMPDGEVRRFRREDDDHSAAVADSSKKPVSKNVKALKPQPISDFISFVHDWGHPEWVVLAVEAPVDQVSAQYASACSARARLTCVPVRDPQKKDDEMASLVAVVQPKDCSWSVIYRVLCLPIGSPDIDDAMKMAKSLSAGLKTRALAFLGEDASGAMQYWLYRNGKQTSTREWESQSDSADTAFVDLGLWVPACYPRRDQQNAAWLIAKKPWDERIERADIVDIGAL